MMDVEKAIKRLGGDDKFFAKVVASFFTDARMQLSEFQHSMEEGRAVDALRCLHTLRGLAATAGARALAQTVAHAETSLRANTAFAATAQAPDAPQHLQAMEEQMAQALQYFEKLGLAPNSVPVSSTEVPAVATLLSPKDKAALLQALDALDTDLRSRKMHAVKVCDSIKQQFGTALGGRLDGLTAATAALNFDKALQASLELRNTLADEAQ